MKTQKEIAQTESVDARPATGKQCWFLAKLLRDSGEEKTISDPVLDTSFVLTCKKARGMINTYIGA